MNSIQLQSSQQPQALLQLRQKAQQLRTTQASLKENNKQLSNTLNHCSDQLQVVLRQKQLQERKSKSLALLVSDLQRQLDDNFSQGAFMLSEQTLVNQQKALRELLVKGAQKSQQDQKLLSFMRQAAASGTKTNNFVLRSKYLEGQAQIIAKLRSQINLLANPNLQCARKWSELGRQTQRLQQEQGFLKVQLQRLKTQARQQYEIYLQSLNRSKASLVHFNQTQKERVITQHLVQEIARLQQIRMNLQSQVKNLTHHQQTLLEQNQRVQSQNRQLRSFFGGSQNAQQQRLAVRMRTRIQQLRDTLIQMEKIRLCPQSPLVNLGQRLRNQLKDINQRQGYLQKKIKEEEQGKSILDEKDVISFFEGVLKGRDQRLQISKEREYAASQKVREATVRKELLSSQIDNLQEGLQYHSTGNYANYQSTFARSDNNVANRAPGGLSDTNFATTTSKYVAR